MIKNYLFVGLVYSIKQDGFFDSGTDTPNFGNNDGGGGGPMGGSMNFGGGTEASNPTFGANDGGGGGLRGDNMNIGSGPDTREPIFGTNDGGGSRGDSINFGEQLGRNIDFSNPIVGGDRISDPTTDLSKDFNAPDFDVTDPSREDR